MRITLGPSHRLRTGVRSAWVHVHDSEYVGSSATYDYAVLYLNDVRADDQIGGDVDPSGPVEIRLWRVAVSKPGTYVAAYGGGEEFSLKRLRDLPLQTWENAAREYLSAAVRREAFREAARSTQDDAVDVERNYVQRTSEPLTREVAADLVRQVHPEIPAGDTPAARRTYESHLRLALVAHQYSELLMDGRNDPSREIARMHDISPGAARSLVHRARQAGYLGKSIGRTAGHRPAMVAMMETPGAGEQETNPPEQEDQ